MKKIVSILLAMVLVFSLAACGQKQEASNQGQNKQGKQQPEGYTVKVTQNGKELKSYTIEQIKSIPAANIEIEGKTEEGPSLSNLLKDAGAVKYSKVTLKGAYKTENVLTAEQAEKDTILDITNHGTVKLATKAIKKNDWVKDIVEIAVEE